MNLHPKTAIEINGKWQLVPCDCTLCERRYPLFGAGLVLLFSGLLAGLAGIVMASCG